MHIVALVVRDAHALRAAYMPFIQYGGIFLRSQRCLGLGESVRLLLSLPIQPGQICTRLLYTRVVWQTPQGAQGNRDTGVGLQFPEGKGGEEVVAQIQDILSAETFQVPIYYTLSA